MNKRQEILQSLFGMSENERDGVADKMDRDYYEERLVLIACPPKSASRVFEGVVDVLAKHYGPDRAINLKITPSAEIVSPPIEQLLARVPHEVCWRTHSPPSHEILHAVEQLRIKAFVLLRHPADLIVANYCHHHGNRVNPTRSGYIDTALSLLDVDRFNSSNLEDGIEMLLNSLFLRQLLDLMAKWLHFRDSDLSMVARYEDYASGFVAVFDDMLSFLYPGAVMEERSTEPIRGAFDGFLKQRKGYEARYPKGYSGKAGIWQDYFTERNALSYNRVVSGFIEYHPYASELCDYYEDLII